jgi:hypothetical protein
MRASIFKLNVRGAAKIAEVCPTTIRKWIDKGELKATECGGGDSRKIFEIDEDDLIECLSKREEALNGTTNKKPMTIPLSTLPKPLYTTPTIQLSKETTPVIKDLNYLKNKIADDQKKNDISLKIISELQFAEEYHNKLMALAQDCNDMNSETYRQAYNKLLKTRFCCE